MKLPSLFELAELEIRKESVEKIASESADKINEQKIKLQRAQRDLTDYSGRLKYGGKGGLNTADIEDLRRKEEQSVSAAREAEKQLAAIENEAKNSADSLRELRRQIEVASNQLKMRFCSSALNEKSSARGGVRDEDGGGSKQPIAASFGENIQKMVDELKYLLVGGGKYPCLKLFVNDAAPINDAAPHYSSWEQRTLTTIFTSKEKLQKVHQRFVDSLNAVSSYYSDLAKNTALWTEFVDIAENSFSLAVADNIERALFLYERALAGKSAPELFSVNLKLTASCRVQLLPSANELPNLLIALIEEKLFTIVPQNTFSDVISATTSHKSGKGVPLKRIMAMKEISQKLEQIHNHVARYGEELVAAVVKIEDRFQSYWNLDVCQKMTLDQLRAARDEVDFDFGFVRQRIFNGAFQMNAFPLQDTLSSLLSSQIDVRRQLEANTSDEALQQMIKTSSVAGARTWSVPPGGLAALLQKQNTSPNKQQGEVWSDKFDPLKFVEQLVARQVCNASGLVGASPTKAQPTSSLRPSSGRSDPVRESPRSLKAVAGEDVSAHKENIYSAVPVSDISSSRAAPLIPSSRPALSSTGEQRALHSQQSVVQSSSPNAGVANKTTTSTSAALAPLVSPRPSSTPSNSNRTSISSTLQTLSMTPNRHSQGRSPTEEQPSHPVPPSAASIRSAELLKSSAAVYAEHTHHSSRGAWDSPSAKSSANHDDSTVKNKRDKPRTIDMPPREPEHAPTTAPLLSPFREKQVVAQPNIPARELRFDDTSSSSVNASASHLPQLQEERRPRSILKSSAPTDQPGSKPPSRETTEEDEDERMLQRLLQKEKESLERIRLMRERDDQKRKEIQAAHRKGMATEEMLKKVSPRSEYQQLLEEQARLEAARRDNEVKLREAEREARRVREEQEAQREADRNRELQEEERQQREWEEQLRRQHEENNKRRAREKQIADDAEREALRRRMEEEEKRRQYQRDLEDRLEEELRRRSQQQQREREERDLARARQEQEAHAAQEAERMRQRAAFERLRNSPLPQGREANDTPSNHSNDGDAAPVQEASALRRKLSLPPVQSATSDSRPATPPSVPIPTSARSGRKPNTAPLGTPRGSIPSNVARSTTSFGAPTAAEMMSNSTPRDRMSPLSPNGNLPERSLLDEYKQYCLNFGIKPNSGLLKSLPSVVGDFATTINLDLNYIGVKGVQPLLQILKRNRGLRLLNLKDNNLENNEVRALVNVLLTDSGNALTHLDLSNNPISLAGGSAIMDLVTAKKSLTTVVLRGTLIQPKVVEKIVEAAESNRRRAAWDAGE